MQPHERIQNRTPNAVGLRSVLSAGGFQGLGRVMPIGWPFSGRSELKSVLVKTLSRPFSEINSRCWPLGHWERQRQIGANFSTIVYEAVEAFNVCGGPCLGGFKAGGRVTCLLPGRFPACSAQKRCRLDPYRT
jgi:hypothetical protein